MPDDPATSRLHAQLLALDYDGPDVKAALKAFQKDHGFKRDGVPDDATLAAVRDALAPPPPAVPCDAATWAELQTLVALLQDTPVRYGPGRGLFHDGQWMVTFGPGALGQKDWTSQLGTVFPSFHCSSWTNFFLGWLLRYDDRFTHGGNVPQLRQLVTAPDAVHVWPQKARWRGYGPHCVTLFSNGDTRTRSPDADRCCLDARELHARRATLPSFLVCEQAARDDDTWSWHHTALFAIDHRSPGTPLFRIAADGSRDAVTRSWSARPMKWTSIDATWIAADLGRHLYRPYAVLANPDGTYGASPGPRPPVVLEA